MTRWTCSACVCVCFWSRHEPAQQLQALHCTARPREKEKETERQKREGERESETLKDKQKEWDGEREALRGERDATQQRTRDTHRESEAVQEKVLSLSLHVERVENAVVQERARAKLLERALALERAKREEEREQHELDVRTAKMESDTLREALEKALQAQVERERQMQILVERERVREKNKEKDRERDEELKRRLTMTENDLKCLSLDELVFMLMQFKSTFIKLKEEHDKERREDNMRFQEVARDIAQGNVRRAELQWQNDVLGRDVHEMKVRLSVCAHHTPYSH